MKEKEIIKRFKYWQVILGLENWDIKVVFRDFSKKEIDSSKQGSFEGLAVTEAVAQYCSATITVSKDNKSMVDDNTIVHELLHCLTSELTGYLMANGKKDAWMTYFDERLVSQLAGAICRISAKNLSTP